LSEVERVASTFALALNQDRSNVNVSAALSWLYDIREKHLHMHELWDEPTLAYDWRFAR